MAKYVAVNKSGKSFEATYTVNGKTEKVSSSEPMVQVTLNTKGQTACTGEKQLKANALRTPN